MNTYSLRFVLLSLVSLMVALLIDMSRYQPHQYMGTVIEKSYAPGSTSVGHGLDTDGRLITTVSSTSERYTLIVQADRVRSVRVSAEVYAQAQLGQPVQVQVGVSPWFGIEVFESIR